MPVTPFHMGPALLVKAAAPRRFSLVIFGVSQVAIDVEPLVGLFRGAAVLHGFSHTLTGATLVAIASVVVGRPLCERVLSTLNGRPTAIVTAAGVIGPLMLFWIVRNTPGRFLFERPDRFWLTEKRRPALQPAE